MKVHSHRRQGSPFRVGRSLAVATVAALTASLALVASPATAAGNGVLDLVVTPTNQANGTTVTDLSASSTTTPIVYKVQYSCTADNCDATQIKFTPPPWQDPYGLNPQGRSVLRYASWVQPAAGGTISGNDTTGMTVNLGNLTAGTSGTFSLTFNGSGNTGGEIMAGQFFPEGADLPLSATATSTTASPKTADTHLTWHAGTIPPAANGPSVVLTSGRTIKPGVTVNTLLGMGTGSMVTSGGNIQGDGRYVATGDYKVVYHAPSEAVIGTVYKNGVVDPTAVVDQAAHTVTWTKGSLANPSYGARGGWGLNTLSSTYGGYGAAAANSLVGPDDQAFWQRRGVDLTFPVSNFPDRDATDCNFRSTVTGSIDVTVHYLDAARTEKSASATSTESVACAAPFGGWVNPTKAIGGGATTSAGDIDLGAGVYGLNVPAPGSTDATNREWRITATNRGNVDATAVIDDDLTGQAPIRVNRITAYPSTGLTDPATWEATVDWTDNTGATGTAALGQNEFVDAAAGRWFTSVHAEMPIKAGATLRTDGTSTAVILGLRFKLSNGADANLGEQRTNTADVQLVYPADADGDGTNDAYTDLNGNPFPTRQFDAQATRKVQFTKPLTGLAAALPAPVIQGGETQVRPGTNVKFSARGNTGVAWPGTTIQPQTVFIAPVGWTIVPASGSLTPGTGGFASIPAGVTYRYGTATFGTDTRDYVVATYPSTVTLSSTAGETWPTLSALAYPTNTAVPGIAPVPTAWAGDNSGTWTTGTGNSAETAAGQFRIGTGNGAATDSPDVDADSNVTEQFAAISTAQAGLAVGATDGLSVVKQLCVPLQGAPDGCSWVSDSSEHLVPADAGTVKYRIQVINAGNTTLHNAVAYDILPYVGDTSALASATPRGSQFALPLASVDSVAAGLTVTGSGSTNPARPEVNPGATGTTNDWAAPSAGNKSLRIAVNGDLAVGAQKDVVISTTLSGASQGQKACNSVAADSAETLPAEPQAVCVTMDAPLNTAPVVDITGPADGAELDYGSDVPAAFTCTDDDLVSCTAVDENGDPVALGDPVDTTTPGTHKLIVTGKDSAGLTTTKTITYTVKAKPNTAPTATITSPTNGADLEYGSTMSNAFGCDDVDGNLVSCVGTDENGDSVANGSSVDTTATGIHTLTVKATDSDGETTTTTVTYTVKRKPNVPPTVDIAKPTEGATYFVGQNVPAAYTCADSDGTVASCTGPVATGSNIDTATVGTKTFKVTATDDEGATASKTVTYKVVPVAGVCRGTALSLLGIGLGVANGKTTPCVTATDKVLAANLVITPAIPLLGVPANSVSTGVLTAATQSGPGSAAAQASVASLKISILGQTIEATGLTSSASSVLSSCGAPAAVNGISSLASLKINGKSIANLTQPSLTVPLIVGSLGINEHGVSGNTVTASALHLNVLGIVDLAVGQSVAGATC